MTIYEEIKELCKQLGRDLGEVMEDIIVAEHETHDLYNEMLNECYPMIDVCGYQYEPAYALSELDPIAYRCGKNDYFADGEWEELDDCDYARVDDLERVRDELQEELDCAIADNEGDEETTKEGEI